MCVIQSKFEIDYIHCHVTQLAVARKESAHSLKSHFPIHESLADSALFNTRDS